MKILIDHFCLAAGGTESPGELSIDGQQPVQISRGLHAATASVLPLGGRVNTIAFAVTREHPSHGAAEGFLFAHAATLPESGQAVFLCEDLEGPQVQYTAAAAAVTADLGTRHGNQTTHKYTLVCGAITGGEPGKG